MQPDDAIHYVTRVIAHRARTQELDPATQTSSQHTPLTHHAGKASGAAARRQDDGELAGVVRVRSEAAAEARDGRREMKRECHESVGRWGLRVCERELPGTVIVLRQKRELQACGEGCWSYERKAAHSKVSRAAAVNAVRRRAAAAATTRRNDPEHTNSRV